MRALCPACREPMNPERYDGNYGRKVDLDVCHHCNALWFDRMENIQLSAGGVLELLKSMHARYAHDRQPLPDRKRCPRCDGVLRKSLRRTKDIRYTVAECSAGDGHFITFHEFLREKDCIRPLKGEKLKALRKQVSSVNCSNCAAPVDLHKTAACTHCGAHLALLDPEAMAESLDRLNSEHDRKSNPDGNKIAADIVLDRLRTERTFQMHERIDKSRSRHGSFGLIEFALDALIDLIT